MQANRSQSKKQNNYALGMFQAIAALGIGSTLFIFVFILFSIGFGAIYAGEIYPGTSVAGIDLSGLSQEEATRRLDQGLPYPSQGQIVFQDGSQVWTAKPVDLGLSQDSAANAQLAFQLGRIGNPLSRLFIRLDAWYSGQNMLPQFSYDEQKAQTFIEKIALQINQPAVEATLKLNGLEVNTTPGQVGRELDILATLASLSNLFQSQSDGIIPLTIKEKTPEILDVEPQAQIVRRILSAPLTLSIKDAQSGDPGPWSIPPEQLAAMLDIRKTGSMGDAQYIIELDEEALTTYMTSLTPQIDRYAANARFIFNDETRKLEVIQPAVIGRTLEARATARVINQQLQNGEHSATLSLAIQKPEIGDDVTGEQLGITELVSSHTSYFRGSSNERLQNIKTAASNFHGLLVPPGATFSMADILGSVSLDTGYAEAWIIFGGRTIKGVGGGVCQVSTTLFRTAFFGGYPIAERHPHAYRVGYYEQTSTSFDENMAGLDATVFVPVVDFKFVNDRPYWLLMETYYYPNSRSLTWKFYSSSDGRTVEWQTSGVQNVVEAPDPVFEENPELAKDEVRQVDWEAEGADVSVVRTVYRDGQVILSDTFVTQYRPWADIYQYGPGTKIAKLIKLTKK